MKIVILGAGQVGSTVARSLSHEDNELQSESQFPIEPCT